MFFAPSMNGAILVIKAERLVAISGRPDDAPAVNPPTKFPTKDPKA